MAESISAFGAVVSGALLQVATYTRGLHVESVADVDVGGGDLGWRVVTPVECEGNPQVSLESAPGADADIFPRVTRLVVTNKVAWDIYLVDQDGAIVDKGAMDSGSSVSFAVLGTDALAGNVTPLPPPP